jgi:hypothetical protein
MENSTACNRERLQRLIDDDLQANEESVLLQHVEECPDCQQTLQSIAAGAEWWNEARHLLTPSQGEEWGMDEDGVTSIRGAQCEDKVGLRLDFLAPTDDPVMLGRLGLYEISGVIGRGGAGIVLKAFERSLNRFVAIKVLSPHLAASSAARKRFAREAQAAAAVVHEHIVPIHAVDDHAGLPYMVMRYVPGHSLQGRLNRQGPLEIREILRIGMQTAAGLAAAHKQGLVHRDVKPANILLENGIERVLLTDFGLARAIDDASMTRSGVIAGTPQYMAPEQARGENVDHRSDLFSLGSVLYAMCTGHSPFRAETTMGVLHRICHDDPRPIRQVNPQIDRALTVIITRLHAKDPARRYQSAHEVSEALGALLAHEQSISVLNVRPWRRLSFVADWVRQVRPRQLLTASCAIALVAGVVGIAKQWIGPRLEEPRSAAVAPSASAPGPIPLGFDSKWEDDAADVADVITMAEGELHRSSGAIFGVWADQVSEIDAVLDSMEGEIIAPDGPPLN